MNKINKNIKLLGVALLSVLLISITMFVINKEREKISQLEPEIQTVYVGYEKGEPLENFNRESAVQKLKEILISVGQAPTAISENKESSSETTESKESSSETTESKESSSETTETKESSSETTETKESSSETTETKESSSESVESKESEVDEEITVADRLKTISDDEKDIQDVLSQETIDMLYFAEEFGKDKFNRQFAASAMLIYYDLVVDSSNSTEFTPVIQSYGEIVYLDSKLMTAHIPLDIFIGSGTGVSFEMQYIDGEWKLNPYTAMMSLNMMGIMNNSIQE